MSTVPRSCGTCGFSWSHLANELVSCGAPVDDDALAGKGTGVNPVWAERKYSPLRIMAALSGGSTEEPPGSNPERLSPGDGEHCKTWRAKE